MVFNATFNNIPVILWSVLLLHREHLAMNGIYHDKVYGL